MCGIAGAINARRIPIAREMLNRMTSTLVHRGPDSSGCYLNNHVGFGFTRLSILDPIGGMQPMSTPDGRITWVCNGEIFNYSEIRDELKRKGHLFRTQCDTEIIGAAFQEYGINFLDRLNGQFAILLYDVRSSDLWAARDHFGIAPLFWAEVNGLFLFGSEIKSILASNEVVRAVDLTGLDQILTFPGLISPRTLFRGISSVPPGNVIRISSDTGVMQRRCYWDLDYPAHADIDPEFNEREALDKLGSALTDAVRLRLSADCRIGFYLSGGLDSMLIAATARRLLGPAAEMHTFAVDFEDATISEGKFQRLGAHWLKSNHHSVCMSASDIVDKLRTVIFHTECCLKETFNTAAMALSKLASDEGVRVVLAGQGADELFGGYIGYRFDKLRRGLPSQEHTTSEESEQSARIWSDPSFFYEKQYREFESTKLSLYSPALREQFPDFDCLQHPIVEQSKLAGRHPFHKRSYIDFKLRLADHLLGDHGDRMVMANSIEGRYPFLDMNIVNIARAMPPDVKLKGLEEKHPLRQVGRFLLPRPFVEREKFGFTAPGISGLIDKGFDYVDDMLSDSRIRRQGFFDADNVAHLKSRYCQPDFRINVPFEDDLLAIVLSFNLFLDVFEIATY